MSEESGASSSGDGEGEAQPGVSVIAAAPSDVSGHLVTPVRPIVPWPVRLLPGSVGGAPGARAAGPAPVPQRSGAVGTIQTGG
ncbi:hypothetical protein GCM10012280_58900 [Wenjunlia tyrosinilytica]|uniref:Uncharacterized protein n=1 Tax=Wenjunlia tyrosinilytica TaxID=1544741 RepID=A0A917ZWS7_9ACTN|nr:hypothetical protein GCM10012280_58900 [Wenjunlia tyrosinilytica]